MSRHRNIRSMNITDEYDGYDDVYGHSVEDDYCISPSDAAFIYDREGSRGQQKISAFFKSDEDIAEEDESDVDKISALDDIDKARLNSCIEKIKSILGELKISEQELVTLILKHNFAVEKIMDIILNAPRQTQPEKLEKDFNMKIDDKSSKQAMESNCLSTLVPSSHLKNSASPKMFNNTENMFSKLRHSTNLTQNSSSNVEENTAKTFDIPKLFSNNPSVENTNQTCLFSSSKLASEKKYDIPTLIPNPTLSSSLPNDSVPIAQHSTGIPRRNSPFVSSEFPRKKFDIPNLFSNSVLSSSLPNSSVDNLSSSPQNLSDTDSSSHASLSSLVSSHLGPKSKIEVPKLFTKSSPRTSPFNSLADLTKTHLQKSENKFQVPKIFGISSQLSHIPPSSNPLGDFAKIKRDNKLELPTKFNNSNNVNVGNKDPVNIQSIDDKLTKCHIDNKPVVREDILNDGWHIDLTNALRDSDIVPLKVSAPCHVETEVFVPEFIDCESENNETHDFLQCNVDLKQFAYMHSALENSVSQFGKIISRTFRYRAPQMYYEEQNVIERFHFANPSPDDRILAYINRE